MNYGSAHVLTSSKNRGWDLVPSLYRSDGTRCHNVPIARWEPNAPERLAVAALDLFAERGYENTKVVEIAERAGLTKSTFFRHFSDKREVLFGGDVMTRLLVEGIVAVPAAAGPLDAVAHALDAVGGKIFVASYREFSARRRAVIAANPELQEREALKGLDLIASMTSAIERRGVSHLPACAAAQMGALALKIAYERWSDPACGGEFSEIAQRTLSELQAATASLTRTGTERQGFEARPAR